MTIHHSFSISRYLSLFLRWLWNLLPFSGEQKQRLKMAFFKKAPFIQDWVGWHNLNGQRVSKSKSKFGSPVSELHPGEINENVPLYQGEPLLTKPVKLICFYLPQFHPIPENNKWWGEGFTEWSNVKPTQPQFVGHYQPHIPGELGYYDLLTAGVQQRQIELAKLYGVEGFCFYFYWFGGERLLETPVQNYLNDKNLDLPFCLCWANENWTRRWDGLDNDILIAQQHSPEDDTAFIQHVAQYMRDSRYIRIDDKPLLLVYRPSLLPSAKETSERWRQWCREHGMGEIYLAYTQSFESVDPADYGFDAAVEFPPLNASVPNITAQVRPLNNDFAGQVYDWGVFVERSQNYRRTAYPLFRGVCPSWDNTARRGNKSSILLHSSPVRYQRWLENAIADTVQHCKNPDQRLIFINAWNEWAEGAHLEPDQRYGYAYLEATRMALVRKMVVDDPQPLKKDGTIAVAIHVFYEDVFDEILSYLNAIHSIPLKLYVTTTVALLHSIESKLKQQSHDFSVITVNNRGRDILPFIKIMPEIFKGGHDLLIKVHTKKSVHRLDGHLWRQDIFGKLITEPAIKANIDFLFNYPELGILGPTGHIVPMGLFFGSNSVRVRQLADRMGVESEGLENLNFVAGTMFMARTQAMIPLMNIALRESDFEEEAKQIDGTLAHAIERLFSVSAQSVGLKVGCPDNKVSKRYRYAKSSSK